MKTLFSKCQTFSVYSAYKFYRHFPLLVDLRHVPLQKYCPLFPQRLPQTGRGVLSLLRPHISEPLIVERAAYFSCG